MGGDALTAIGSHNFHPGAAREKHLLNGWQQQPRGQQEEEHEEEVHKEEVQEEEQKAQKAGQQEQEQAAAC